MVVPSTRPVLDLALSSHCSFKDVAEASEGNIGKKENTQNTQTVEEMTLPLYYMVPRYVLLVVWIVKVCPVELYQVV